MNAIIHYLQNAKVELHKVSWPTKEQTINSTALVIGASVAIAAFLAALDYGLNQLLEFVFTIV